MPQQLSLFDDNLNVINPSRHDSLQPRIHSSAITTAFSNGEIKDVGEKIGGAKKDRFQEMVESYRKDLDLDSDAILEKLKKKPVSKIFNFDLEKLREGGAPNEVVSFLKIAKDCIPTKPRTSYKVESWARTVQAVYTGCLRVVADWDKAKTLLDSDHFKDSSLHHVYDAYMEVGGFDSGKSIGMAELYQIPKGETTFDEHWNIVDIGGQWRLANAGSFSARFKTREEAVARLRNYSEDRTRIEQRTGNMPKLKETAFAAYHWRSTGKGFITPKGKSSIIVMDGFETGKEALQYLKDHKEELQKKYDAMRAAGDVRFAANRVRKGEDWRKGKDVSAKEFMETFGFRAVEFGNWMKQGERQEDLNRAYDAYMDLASVLHVSPKALSLGGSLAMAFGSRGGGRFNAHYEPSRTVINLTKTRGAGSLAHEWFHALDHYFARQGKSEGMATDGAGVLPEGLKLWDNGRGYYDHHVINQTQIEELRDKHSVRKAVADEWINLVNDIRQSPYGKRSVSYSNLHTEYWRQPTEMGARAFSVWVQNQLGKEGYTDDYLANNPELHEAQLGGDERHFNPYPFDTDKEWIEKSFGRLFGAVRENGQNILYQLGDTENIVTPSTEEKALRDNLIGILRKSGIDVVTDTGEAQAALAAAEKSNLEINFSYAYDNLKKEQLEIILRTNPMTDDYHLGIRTVNDIKTFDEAVEYGLEENIDTISSCPDAKDIIYAKARETGVITVFSSYPIEDGVFVSPSRMMAEDYAGGRGKKVYSKEVQLDDVAWLNSDEGQYAHTGGINVRAGKQTKPSYFKGKKGETYGFALDGKIYVDPRIATAETPIHEYTHLWAAALRVGNPKEWENVKNLMRGTAEWNEIADNSQYSHLKNDDEIADEVLATYSGREGAKKLREKMELLKREGKDTSVLSRIEEAIRRFWTAVADMFHVHFDKKEDISEQIMRDILNGVNPMELLKLQYEQKVQDIIDKSKKNGTYLLAPNGQKSNLGKWQWAVVRLPEFKEWFGDWELSWRKNYLFNSPSVSDLKGDEFSQKEGVTLTEQVELFYNKLGNVAKSPIYGDVILDAKGISDSLAHGIGRNKAIAYASVKDVIEKGVVSDYHFNHKGRGYDTALILAPITISKERYICQCVIKKDLSKNRFYLHEVTAQKSLQNGVFLANLAQKPTQHQGDIAKVLKNIITAKQSSKILDKNGEPRIMYHGTPLSRDDYERTIKGTGWQRDGSFIPQRAPFHTFHGGAYGGLIFLTPDYDVAHSIATERAMHIPDDDNGKEQYTSEDYVFDTFINVRNPFNAEKDGEKVLAYLDDNDIKAIDFYFGGEKSVSREEAKSILHSPNSWMLIETASFQNKVRELGYDGIIGKDRGDEYVAVLHPNQIKSASENIGTYRSYTNDIRYQFAGIHGMQNLGYNSTVDYSKDFSFAEEMLKSGKDAHDVKLATGWEMGVDGKWRYELPDADIDMSQFDYRNDDKVYVRKRPLYKVLTGEGAFELFKAYPELRKYKVQSPHSDSMPNVSGDFDGKHTLRVSSSLFTDYEEMRRTLLHEVQHAIQEIEGFAVGGSPSKMKDMANKQMDDFRHINAEWQSRMNDILARRDTLMRKIIEEHPGSTQQDIINYATNDKECIELQKEWRDVRSKEPVPPGTAEQLYHRLAGETEARNVENRLDMSSEQRRSTILSDTADVSDRRQIVIFRDVLENDNLSDSFNASKSLFKENIMDMEKDDKYLLYSVALDRALLNASIFGSLTLGISGTKESGKPFDALISSLFQEEGYKKDKAKMIDVSRDMEIKHPHLLVLFRDGNRVNAYFDSAKKLNAITGNQLLNVFHRGFVIPYSTFPKENITSVLSRLNQARAEVSIQEFSDAVGLQYKSEKDIKDAVRSAIDTANYVGYGTGVTVERLLRSNHPSEFDEIGNTLYYNDVDENMLAKDGGSEVRKANDIYRAVAAVVGTPLRLNREARFGHTPDDAMRHEYLVRDLSAAILMSRLGMPSELSHETVKNIQLYRAELMSNPNIVEKLMDDVNMTVDVIDKYVRGEKVDYASYIDTDTNRQRLEPSQYTVVGAINRIPDATTQEAAVVGDRKSGSATVIIPIGSRIEEGIKEKVEKDMRNEGYSTVTYHSAGGSDGLVADNKSFEGKEVSLVKIGKEGVERKNAIDLSPYLGTEKRIVSFRPIKDDKGLYAFFIKPEGERSFSVYPSQQDMDTYFNAKSRGDAASVHSSLALKYYVFGTTYPEQKRELVIPKVDKDIDMSKITDIWLSKSPSQTEKDGRAATVLTARVNGSSVSHVLDSWERTKLWMDKDLQTEYKTALAGKVFGPMLREDVSESKANVIEMQPERTEKRMPEEEYHHVSLRA